MYDYCVYFDINIHINIDIRIESNANIGIHIVPISILTFYQPEKRGRKPGMSLNGDRILESMGGIVAEEPAW